MDTCLETVAFSHVYFCLPIITIQNTGNLVLFKDVLHKRKHGMTSTLIESTFCNLISEHFDYIIITCTSGFDTIVMGWCSHVGIAIPNKTRQSQLTPRTQGCVIRLRWLPRSAGSFADIGTKQQTEIM